MLKNIRDGLGEFAERLKNIDDRFVRNSSYLLMFLFIQLIFTFKTSLTGIRGCAFQCFWAVLILDIAGSIILQSK